MIIVGAKGFAKEVLEICYQKGDIDNLVFYDDVNDNIGNKFYEKFDILKDVNDVKNHFVSSGNTFALGLGNPQLRYKLRKKFEDIGGKLVSVISPRANIAHFGVSIGDGSTILSSSLISNDVTLGEACILYFNSVITHDCVIGNYVEISPSVTVLGRVSIGSFSQLGAGSTILPDVSIGKNVIIGAGSVVNKDIPDNSLAFGIPAKVFKQVKPLNL